MVVVLTGTDRVAVGGRLAESLGWDFVDGDQGIDRLRESIREWVAQRRNVVLAAPRRERLAVHPAVRFLHLVGADFVDWTRDVPVIDVDQPIDDVVDAARTLISL